MGGYLMEVCPSKKAGSYVERPAICSKLLLTP
jgi:hypothetical protein